MAPETWKPHESLTQAPTNLKEAIDWVLRVTGRDGNPNKAAAKPAPAGTDSSPHCLCYLAKAVKDLLYDAKDPGSPGPSQQRYWDTLLLDQEKTLVLPVLLDLGLVNGGSTSAARDTCSGGTEVIRALIDQLAQGLQKWVGWQETGDDCCLKGENGIGKKCDCTVGGGATCCTPSSSCNCDRDQKCYKSAYQRSSTPPSTPSTECYYWPTLSDKADQVHLLARIFLGSVCLIWSGLSQLGFLTGDDKRWNGDALSEVGKGLGSFMAAMGYDLDRLNQGAPGQKGEFVWNLLSGKKPDDKKGIQWKEFQGGSTSQGSVAEYYSSIYGAVTENNTEKLCKDYPLLVLHILASGYFRAGSAGANKITPPKAATTSDPKKDNGPRKPRTIREILYWLSALPYSKGYKALVERMGQKFPEGGKYSLEGTKSGGKTDLHKDNITHYLLAACGYCPLVLIGIQGTIEKEVDKAQPQPAQAPGVPGVGVPGAVSPAAAAKAADDKRCPEHKKNPSAKRCNPKDIKEPGQAVAPAAPAASAPPAPDTKLQLGQVCYGGYHLAVKDFGPLHGMYANGLFGFDMEGSPAQCLDQLRIYVYHCFYQLYFLRKQCGVGVVDGGAGKTVLGWKSCRYGSGVNPSGGVSNQNPWRCEAPGSGNDCQCKKTAGHQSPLMYFLCDGLGPLVCKKTVGVGLGSNKQSYPEIDAHMNKTVDSKGKEHEPHRQYPQLCPVPMGWSAETGTGNTQQRENHFKDLTQGTHKTDTLSSPQPGTATHYPAHCTGRTLSLLLEYYCDPGKQHGTLVLVLRLLACITPTVPRTLGDLFGFYYYIVYIGGNMPWDFKPGVVRTKLETIVEEYGLGMLKKDGTEGVIKALKGWSTAECKTGTQNGTLKCLVDCTNGTGSQYLCPLSGQQYGQLSPLMAGTYLSWLVYLIEKFEEGLQGLVQEYKNIVCKDSCSSGPGGGAVGCNGGQCQAGTHGGKSVCCCDSVVSCTGVLPVLYKYGFGYGDVSKLHKDGGPKKCHDFLGTLESVLGGEQLDSAKKGLHHEINKLIYTTRLPWIFVLTLAWLMAVLYLAFGAIWPLDWTHMRSHCRGWFRKGSLSPWEVLMVGKKKGRGILEFFGGR